jgi:predicted nucleotidyltransferase
MTLKELRNEKGLTQSECAKFLGVPLRTYVRYENNATKKDSIKYQFIMEKLNEFGYVDEEHGILTIKQIKDVCSRILKNYEVDFCYLFGSYAKGKAKETSDVDLLISANVTGIKFFGLVEELRESLKKKVDLLDLNQLNNNEVLVKEILKDGIKIYG